VLDGEKGWMRVLRGNGGVVVVVADSVPDAEFKVAVVFGVFS
jgi:hypothetical protein